MEEIWKQIDDRYSVSNLGRVKSNYANKERILKPFIDCNGYLKVDFRHGENRKTYSVHRLVATAFIPNENTEQLIEVNHKDEDKTNNRADNLEWCDTLYNCNYGTRNIRKAIGCNKSIFSVDEFGNIKNYTSVKEASNAIGVNTTLISKALTKNNNNLTAGNMLWFYDTEENIKMVMDLKIKAKLITKRIYSVDENNNIEYFESITEAKDKTGINNINRALKEGNRAGKRYWYYAE